ncbi:3-oxoadipate enol-lactonase [Mesorhizobium sp. YC-39]|uniref:3-oxoadipate enol-lactonase n=1 Tax=unclassified Mesorhizobium TaxID=325217 RepID=UPI0021E6D7E2|nr:MULTISPECIES: 3-oxoadipate enol-lactonase [unclassified Mesorhizobium]MCV3211208.1 3-oxoadipate enol-lactonase [Mesorhizobium sp. YC-2]MCV3232933.1 3-oxoadipate enol-lactonase [Mesorhizobium sp. YC-39]
MNFARIKGVTLHYRIDGPSAAPPLVLVNSLGTDARIWDDFIAILAGRYCVLSYDKRGHGLSDAVSGPYRLEDHLDDLFGLADFLGIGGFALAGVSVGGLIAQGAAARHGARIRALVLCDTAAKIGTASSWDDRIRAVMAGGTIAIADSVMERWFSPGFRRERPAELAGWRNMLVRADRWGYASTCSTLRDTDLTAETATIGVPSLVLAGEHDLSTPPDLVRETAALIRASRFEIIRGAGHIPSIEQPAALAALVTDFMKEVGYV